MGVRRDSPHGVSIGAGGSRGGGSVARRRRDSGGEGIGVAPGRLVFLFFYFSRVVESAQMRFERAQRMHHRRFISIFVAG